MKVTLNRVRGSFLQIFEPKGVGDSKDKSYSGRFILPKDHRDIAKLEAAIREVAADKWKDKAEGVLSVLEEDDKLCLHKRPYRSKSGEVYAGFEGNWNVSARRQPTDGRPKTYDLGKNEIGQDSGLIYSGGYYDVSLDVWAQDNAYGRRVNATLLGLRFVEHGDAFSGAAPASADDFADREGGERDENTASASDFV